MCFRFIEFILFLICFNTFTPCSIGQVGNLRFEQYTTADGLLHEEVHDVQLDSLGFVWAATNTGLSRFDGFSFVNYPMPFPIQSDRNIFGLDRQNHLWFTDGLDLYYFDRMRDSAILVPLPDSTRKDRFTFIDDPLKEAIWFRRGTALYRIMHGTKTPQLVTNQLKWSDRNYSLRDSKGRFWFGGCATTGGIECYDVQKGHLFSLSFPSNCSHRFTEAPNGNIWIGTWSNGIYKLDPERKTMTQYKVSGDAQNIFYDLMFMPALTGDSVLWCRSDALYLFNLHTEQFVQKIENDPLNPYSLPRGQFSYGGVDAKGRMWIGGGKSGLMMLNPEKQQFVRRVYGDVLNMQDSRIWSIHARSLDESLLFATQEKVAINQRVGKKWAKCDVGFFRRTTNGQLYLHPCRDASDRLWIGCDGSIFLMDEVNWRIQKKVPVPFSKTSDDLWEFRPDGLGNIWFANQKYLCKFDTRTEKIERMAFDPKRPSRFPDLYQVGFLQIDADGRIWFLALDNNYEVDQLTADKIACYDPKTDQTQVFDINEGLPVEQFKFRFKFFHFILDNNSFIWVGTRYGLLKIDQKTGAHKLYRLGEYGPKPCEWIEQDQFGFIWVATREGLIRFDPKTEIWQTFTRKDGLFADRTQELYFFQTKLYLGYDNGYFDEVNPAAFLHK